MSNIFSQIIDDHCQKIYDVFKCQVIFLDPYQHCCHQRFITNMTPPYKDSPIHYLTHLFKNASMQESIVILKSKEELYYIGITLNIDDHYCGRYIIGPLLEKAYTSIQLQQLYQDDIYDIDILTNYYRQVKKMSYETMCVYASLCKNMLETTIEDSFLSSMDDELQAFRNQDIIDQKEYAHQGYNTDKIMLECVKNGYPGEAKRFLNDYWKYSGRRELLEGNLRDRKNFSISYVAMLIQGAIEGGMDYEIASRLNLRYIDLIEQKNLSSELEQLEIEILYDLSSRVKKLKRQGNTKLIRDCKDYIMENIAMNLKVQLIAEYFDVDSKYLARRFKKETNETIKNYIQRKKVEEAKRIMQSSHMNLIDIATNLSFHDQSHFTKIFKEFSGMTPKQYYKNIKSK